MKYRFTSDEVAVLQFLSAHRADEENCYPFAPIAQRTGLDRRRVRRACRSLARKGLTQFERGLWTEDGEPAGSGYCLSEALLALL